MTLYKAIVNKSSTDLAVRNKKLADASHRPMLHFTTDHTEAVSALCSLEDNSTLVSGSWDKSIKLWQMNKNELMCHMTINKAHESGITALCSLGRDQFASASADAKIKVWQASTGTCVKVLAAGHTKCVSSLVALPDGRLASASHDCTVKVCKWNGETTILTLKGHTDQVTCLQLLHNNKQELASGSQDRTVKVWNYTTGKCRLNFDTQHADYVTALQSLSDARLATAGGKWQDATIKIWNDEAKLLLTLTGHTNEIRTLLVFDSYLVSGSWDRRIKLWNVDNGDNIMTLNSGWHVLALCNLNGKMVSASDDKSIQLWTFTTE